MKFVHEFRDPQRARTLLAEIRQAASEPWVLMEVCGGQTHSLLRHGIVDELDGVIELIHGPGCPVCVTPVEAIDFAQRLSLRPGVVLASFGDMLRVPGGEGSLLNARSSGGELKIVYSPLDAVTLARETPDKHVVFFAVGFETTAPATALAVLQAERLGLENFSILAAHVRVEPAMEAILGSPGNRIQGFLAAGHVCTITGVESYHALAEQYRVPIAVTGFEPVDLLNGILECVRQLEAGDHRVVNCYPRSVQTEGNPEAQQVVEQVYRIDSRAWRGMGVLPLGGFSLRDEWSQYDARKLFSAPPESADESIPDCRSGEVLTGRIRPPECPHFGIECTPRHPLGAPMVSSEGACAAYYRFRRPDAGMPDVATTVGH